MTHPVWIVVGVLLAILLLFAILGHVNIHG